MKNYENSLLITKEGKFTIMSYVWKDTNEKIEYHRTPRQKNCQGRGVSEGKKTRTGVRPRPTNEEGP